MSDHDTAMMSDDLELITRYLNDQLPPEQRGAVEQRLSNDEAFYQYVEPMLFRGTRGREEASARR
jgi:anti-sigma factor RsiW